MKKLSLWLYILGFILSALLAGTKVLDHYGYQYTDEALKRSLIAFGIARGLNGLISVAQEAEIAMQPAGIGLTVSPGEILDPVNDLIERFSVVMLVSASAIGIQKLLLAISAWQYFNGFVIIFWLSLASYYFFAYRTQRHINPSIVKFALFLIAIRFATPIMALSSEAIYHVFLQQNYQQANQELEAVSVNIQQQSEQHQPITDQATEQSFIDQAQRWLNNTSDKFNLNKQIEAYKATAEQASRSVIELITIFVVQTLLFPLIFLWLLFKSSFALIQKKRLV